ncbi:MAG: HEAT repeat domain-containing protein [Candidatus Poribacteria bacterium]|nr:HEAT repeat domain-containing protein [Candidatus Poribacteria bacterium]
MHLPEVNFRYLLRDGVPNLEAPNAVVDVLKKALSDEDEEFRDCAKNTLYQIGTPEALAALEACEWQK